MIKPYYHTKPKPSGCFGWKIKQALKDAYRALWCGPYYIALRNPFAFYEYVNITVMAITTTNQNPVTVLVATIKMAPQRYIWCHGACTYWQKEPIHLWECMNGQAPSQHQTKIQWVFWSSKKVAKLHMALGSWMNEWMNEWMNFYSIHSHYIG